MAKSEVGEFVYVRCGKPTYKFKGLKLRYETIFSKFAINICIREWSENNGSGTYDPYWKEERLARNLK